MEVLDLIHGKVDDLVALTKDHARREGKLEVSIAKQSQAARAPPSSTSKLVILNTEKQVEVSFTRTWNSSFIGKLPPLNIDKRFIMLRGSSGFYTYAIYERPVGWPSFTLTNTRLAFKLNKIWFDYMALSDSRQRDMPLPDDRSPERSQVLAYPEAVLLTNPIEEEFKGEVDDKYQYSGESKDIQVHGWICKYPPTGLWQITPNNEFRSSGPLKQYLTSHVGPTSLSVLLSTHYSGGELMAKFEDGEPWKKVLGPLFVHVNSLPKGADWHLLWHGAKQKMVAEAESWPYDFPASHDFPTSDQRANVSGRMLVYERYFNRNTSATAAFVGLAAAGEVGSWQRESKGYQFWTTADEQGYFSINNIRPGSYNLYAWVPGFIGDYRYDAVINIAAGFAIEVGALLYEPPRDGPTIWEIGFPDRSAAEFYVPDPDPKYINRLYVNQERFRQYGLWVRYTDLYPDRDLVYTVNISDFQKDWFFAQVNRKINNTYQGTTWQIRFNLDNVSRNGTYFLRLAIASATASDLQVRINDPEENPPVFSSGEIGKDNTIARHGIHGLYWLYNVEIEGSKFLRGNNTIFLTQALGLSPWRGILYDYLRLEGPP
ncbi:hypothetical protein Nepgr_015926 [Nepenthes gracilis]|uniref:Rhamnogalacturonan endolyase n=1 Tax=Nepenthes gracilis TaxID=150966 RepID=A0AAD3XS25_NEPGR|nr:hypothetical protein Nepgr_015926 [Nepenthes gracilis]